MNDEKTCCLCGSNNVGKNSDSAFQGDVLTFCNNHYKILRELWVLLRLPFVAGMGPRAQVLCWLAKHPEWMVLL